METASNDLCLVNSMAMEGQSHADLFRSAIVCTITCEWNAAQTTLQIDDRTILCGETDEIDLCFM